jgi:hypothetical protein
LPSGQPDTFCVQWIDSDAETGMTGVVQQVERRCGDDVLVARSATTKQRGFEHEEHHESHETLLPSSQDVLEIDDVAPVRDPFPPTLASTSGSTPRDGQELPGAKRTANTVMSSDCLAPAANARTSPARAVRSRQRMRLGHVFDPGQLVEQQGWARLSGLGSRVR